MLERAAGLGLLVLGVVWIGAYIRAVLEVVGQPDRSIIYWGLPVLFLGVGAVAAGVALLVHARRSGS